VDIRHDKENRMLRKSILAFAAVAALGAAVLTPTAASAHWYGSGWYGYNYHPGWSWHYRHYPYRGFYGRRFFYGGKYVGWKPYRYY